jgi:hypothetical protein
LARIEQRVLRVSIVRVEFRERIVEVRVNDDAIFVDARRPPTDRRDSLESDDGFSGSRDDDLLPLLGAVDEPRKMGLRLVNVDGCHVQMMT